MFFKGWLIDVGSMFFLYLKLYGLNTETTVIVSTKRGRGKKKP